jgi:ABC-type transport system involved in cytochrome c biogenesis permease subunit
MSLKKHLVTLGLLAFGGLWFGAMALMPGKPVDGFDLAAFGKIPVQAGGRVQPISSFARNQLMVVTGGRTSYRLNGDAKRSDPATHWLLRLLARDTDLYKSQFLRIDDPEIRQFFKLETRPEWWRYAYDELAPRFSEYAAKMEQIDEKVEKKQKLTRSEEAFQAFSQNLMIASNIQQGKLLGLFPDGGKVDDPWTTLEKVDAALANEYLPKAKEGAMKRVREDLQENAEKYKSQLQKMGEEKFMQWVGMREQAESRRILGELVYEARGSHSEAAKAFMKIVNAFRTNDPETFNAGVAEYLETHAGLPERVATKVRYEAFLNKWDPFFTCQWLYVLVVVCAALSWLVYGAPLRSGAFALAIFTVAFHAVGLGIRMYIAGRPPVTNLYSSAVFIGLGGLAMCLVLEVIYKNGLGSFVGGLLGFGTMLVARFLGSNGETLENLEAVLDTNFWLATHVTIVTLGYAATFMAGALGLAFIFSGMFTNVLRKDNGRELYRMMYGSVCFATLLSFVGTVLGGIWADESWGRFWGWDPKENGAVLIVLWNALALHARWAGMVQSRGFAVLCTMGIMVTIWSWFGTNQLGVGLHAYGFNKELATGCAVGWALTFLCACLGMVPKAYWASFGPAGKD